MYYSLIVNVGHSVNNRPHNTRYFQIGKLLSFFGFLRDGIKKFWMPKVFHAHVQFAFELDQVAHLDDVLVIELVQESCLRFGLFL